MEQSMRKKNNNQINIVLNHRNKISVSSPEQKQNLSNETVTKHEMLQRIEEEMSKLVGMQEIKKIIKEIYAWIYVNKKRQEMGLKSEKQVLHMLFKGNPGTGKTTVARMIGKLLFEMNVLSKGHLVEAERADLVGEYIGHTAQKTRDLIRKAMGGILFIDEAYSLARGGEKDFGKEAIDTLVKHMEDKQHAFVLILAGYSREMNHFLSLNPGLQSRFPFIIEFSDYTVNQLLEIGKQMYEEREYQLSKEAEWNLRDHLNAVKYSSHITSFSNGRYVRNIVEKSIRTQAMRLLQEEAYDKYDLITISSSDLTLEEEVHSP
ncbi:stage V sporulation protein K [Bacillus multifaciens]|uniref:stage V sporulation protein K n=1 Tax=Bacillus multifaciens TaxID=3068506 RepID=UPI00274243C1|nr:stage V sporulation protein K [Bacillus sp. WLY-B-L8]MDP7980139.1 stage V sporulation protein K [Bacillus sp. WLY-B-L8]HDX9589231.1 stage V sporulation protein K [Bacillus pseudomycoides]